MSRFHNFRLHCVISALQISKKQFATFYFFVKMKLVSTVSVSTSLSKFGYLQSQIFYEQIFLADDVLKMIQSELTLKKLGCTQMWQKLIKLLVRFGELSPILSNKQHFFEQQNVLQHLRHKSVDFQCKIIELTP